MTEAKIEEQTIRLNEKSIRLLKYIQSTYQNNRGMKVTLETLIQWGLEAHYYLMVEHEYRQTQEDCSFETIVNDFYDCTPKDFRANPTKKPLKKESKFFPENFDSLTWEEKLAWRRKRAQQLLKGE